MKMSARKFFLLQKQIRRIRALNNYDLWLMVNYCNLKEEFRDKTLQRVIKDAFPETKDEEPWWKNPPKGLQLVKEG
jgi:hypothetical protein